MLNRARDVLVWVHNVRIGVRSYEKILKKANF